MMCLEDIQVGVPFSCGSFSLTRDEIVEFASRFDPQPFHLDEAAAARSYFGGLVASGLHTQAAAIGLMVRRLSTLAVVAGGALHEAKFIVPVRPDVTYSVSAVWTETRSSARNLERGVAKVSGTVRAPDGVTVATFGVTYVVRRQPFGREADVREETADQSS